MRAKNMLGIISLLMASFILPLHSNASWVDSFVVWDGYVYVISDEPVENVEKEIGHVTKYSDKEGTYGGNFSNTFDKGTKYYSITGISTVEAIAVQTSENTYVKAISDGKYKGKKIWQTTEGIVVIIISFVLILGIITNRPEIRRFNK
ncbi:hypothetical protein ACFFF5_05650 [Lederbergia wuyishanensis]|uniref:Uncharacterized protein n=1 Tax=Lederbergia wuyishanensis TaxID=1347903 RepID=A0ABU0CYS9_9BACI|nr:hypothetical protein [Lederbergia wuyishanensis]MCJ8005933.1 hypothetical protein [Lederbergia wuyishanensis]MDQ0341298.1 hypothetical protein [Lederbergia wuyishanensis]